MNYSISQWIGVIEWLLLMLIIFTGVFVVSCIIANKMLHKEKKKSRTRKTEKKNYFIDVA